MKHLLIILLSICCLHAEAQTISGKIIDKSTRKSLPFIFVTAYSGSAFTKEDGTFSINITKFADTIRINSMGYKPYIVAVSRWGDISRLIALEPQPLQLGPVNIKAKRDFYKDSISTRREFARQFANSGPKITDILHPTATNVPFAFVTLDVGMLVGLFTKNKSPDYKLKQQLLRDEQEKHVSQRFNKSLAARITLLKGDSLEVFIINYRPTAAKIDKLSDYDLMQYIKSSLQTFRTDKRKATELQPKF
ncbi:carboxypeptidase-like regulatory domain-containing protein [Inquilinus sp. KBS0705]|nr:carboxypeptidase-like regulatory domain-containing protein [Inquilinus sp. KBS0705]